MSGLNCIFDLASNDLLDNSTLVGRGKLSRTAITKVFLVWMDLLKDLATIDFPIPVWNAICQQEISREAREIILSL